MWHLKKKWFSCQLKWMRVAVLVTIVGLLASCGSGGSGDSAQSSKVPDQQSGSLSVTLGPSGALSAGAQWNTDGGTWQNGGATVGGLSVGSHTVNYKAVTGWTAPSSESVSITNGQTTTLNRSYLQQIRNVKAVSTVIASKEDSLPNITVGKIDFETSDDCATSVEINGKHYDAGKGTSHTAYVYDDIDQPQYTIYATTDEGIEFRQNGVLDGDLSGMFSYSGEVAEYLDYLVPVVISIYEEYKDSGDLLDVIILGGIDYFSLFQKENVFSMDETTIGELYDSLSGWYEANRVVLRSAWPFFSDDQIKAASILNVVSYLWHFGNFERINRSGCVQVNELITADSGDFIYEEYEGEEPLYWRTAVGMGDYINSMIGCCTDHAFLTKALLEEAGLESRRVLIPGHWLTEVLMDSYWYTIDATAGIMVNASTEAMVQGTRRTAYLFFTPYMDFDSEDRYASRIYPWFPTVSMGTGLPDHILEESEFEIILGYYDNPPFKNELEQLDGR